MSDNDFKRDLRKDNGSTVPFESTWQASPSPEEIKRQQEMIDRLKPGCEVELTFDDVKLGKFSYAGIWDTMHSFYPIDASTFHPEQLSPRSRRYCRRDLRGRHYFLIPYTILADAVRVLSSN